MAISRVKPYLNCKPCSDNVPLVLSTSPLVQVPASLAQYLRDYQRDGVRFLFQHYQAGGGCILADDMGLGKTIQAIAFMAAILKMTGTKLDELRHVTDFIRREVAPDFTVPSFYPVLIVCPASLSDNWKEEISTWGYFKSFKFAVGERSEIINRAKHQDCDIVIATFEAVRSHTDLINSVHWSCVIVDEVHRIKDVNSQTTKALCSIKNKRRFGLTGTPVQNNMKELWCILNWANPNCLGPLSTFLNDTVRVMELGHRQNATKQEVTDSNLARLKVTSNRRQYMLKRSKKILEKHLPTKTDLIVFCELTPVQEELYKALVQSPDLQTLLQQSKTSGNDCKWISLSSGSTQPSKRKAGVLFTYMHLLQKAANHPALLISASATTSSDIAYDVCLDVLERNSLAEAVNSKKQLQQALARMDISGKMQVLFQLIGAFLKRGDKILIFSYSTKLLDLIERQLIKKGLKFSRLDGSTPVESRQQIVQTFNFSPHPSIFLISTRAGGVGLNITGANVVIIYDPNWNPAHDLQAQDRAYRLGQERDVRVYRLLSTATIEEYVYLRQLYKQQLASVTVSDASAPRYFNSIHGDRRYYGELFGIQNIFSFRQSRRSLTEEILHRQENVELNLKLKLQIPVTDESFGAKVQPCPLENEDTAQAELKSGLTELCEDILGFQGNGPEINFDSDVGSDDEDGEEMENPLENSIANILETTAAVRNIVEHDAVVAPSGAEELMGDLAVRDVLQKQRNFQLPAFECVSNSQGFSSSPVHKEPLAQSSGRSWTIIRMVFHSMAKKEYLTPYEFGMRVLSLTSVEKSRLLEKHQNGKRSACPSFGNIPNEGPSVNSIQTSNNSKVLEVQSNDESKPNGHDSAGPEKHSLSTSIDQSAPEPDVSSSDVLGCADEPPIKVSRKAENSITVFTEESSKNILDVKEVKCRDETNFLYPANLENNSTKLMENSCFPEQNLAVYNSSFLVDFLSKPKTQYLTPYESGKSVLSMSSVEKSHPEKYQDGKRSSCSSFRNIPNESPSINCLRASHNSKSLEVQFCDESQSNDHDYGDSKKRFHSSSSNQSATESYVPNINVSRCADEPPIKVSKKVENSKTVSTEAVSPKNILDIEVRKRNETISFHPSNLENNSTKIMQSPCIPEQNLAVRDSYFLVDFLSKSSPKIKSESLREKSPLLNTCNSLITSALETDKPVVSSAKSLITSVSSICSTSVSKEERGILRKSSVSNELKIVPSASLVNLMNEIFFDNDVGPGHVETKDSTDHSLSALETKKPVVTSTKPLISSVSEEGGGILRKPVVTSTKPLISSVSEEGGGILRKSSVNNELKIVPSDSLINLMKEIFF